MAKTYDQGVSNGELRSLTEDVAEIKRNLARLFAPEGFFGPEGTCQKRGSTLARQGGMVKVLLGVFALLVTLNLWTLQRVSAIRDALPHAAPQSVKAGAGVVSRLSDHRDIGGPEATSANTGGQ